ncbi:MAG: AAA family ATPase [Pseudomonadota bacterium]|jgi:predicted ABC-type ATPase
MPVGEIIVAAGVNGAGKSTIVGRYVQDAGGAYYNPDERTRAYVEAGLSQDDANGRSWQDGYEALKRAIDTGTNFTFETPLGGKRIVAELFRALARGRGLTIYYVGLESVELHLQRVAARVRRGGHDIPAAKIRERFAHSRENLLGLIGTQASIRVWDNSEKDGHGLPRPVDVLGIESNRLKYPDTLKAVKATPSWAKPLVARALEVCDLPAALRSRTTPR